MARISHKRGDTFNLTCEVDIDFGNQVTLIRSQIRQGSTLVEDLTFTELAASVDKYRYLLSATKDQTELWPARVLSCDIEYQINDSVGSTETFEINVIADVTR
jgi:hypothetical protein